VLRIPAIAHGRRRAGQITASRTPHNAKPLITIDKYTANSREHVIDAATLFGTHIRQASITSSRSSSRSIAPSRTWIQLYLMSDVRGSMNLSGSAATIAARSSLGKPTPITVSSRENAAKTMRPTRNLIWSRTTTSYDLGNDAVMRRTSSTVITSPTLVAPPDNRVAVHRDPVDEQSKPEREPRTGIFGKYGLAVGQLGASGVELQP